MKKNFMVSALTTAVLATLGANAMAQTTSSTEKPLSQETTFKSGEVLVEGQTEPVLTGESTLTQADIRKRPAGDSNVTDLLRSNPTVQFSNSSSSSLQQGEIKPANISIHGSDPYQNNYQINGMSANSDLDPAEQTSITTTRLGSSDEQGFYVDSHLIDSVTVYDHDIPAEFGQFTGGVVDVTTRKWDGENKFRVFGRTTEADWSRVHTDPKLDVDNATGDISKGAQFQKDFTKRSYGFNAAFGFTEDLGMVFGYSRRESKIPTLQLPGYRIAFVPGDFGINLTADPVAGGMKDQKRRADNVFTKVTYYASPRTEYNLGLTYSGYTSDTFLNSVVDSDYTDKHDGLNLTADFEHQANSFVWTGAVGVTHMTDERDSVVDNWSQAIVQEGTGIDAPREDLISGGLGDLKSTQNVFTARTKLAFDPIDLGKTSHKFSVGGETTHTRASYDRDKNYYRWSASLSKMQHWETGEDIISGSYQQTTRWEAGKYKADFTNVALFAEDEIKYKRLTVRPGVRAEYNSFTKKADVAPRFTASFDVFGNENTMVTMGANRYYGRTMLAYALYEAQNGGMANSYFYETDTIHDPETVWFPAFETVGLKNLKTPYSDEFSAGLSQRMGPVNASLAYVHRNGRDNVRSNYKTIKIGSGYDAKIVNRRTFNNDGVSEHDNVIFTLGTFKPVAVKGIDNDIKLSVGWSKTTSNSALGQGYSDAESAMGLVEDYVLYDGKLMKAEDLDSTDFNIPLKIILETTQTWDTYGLTFYNQLRWDGHRDQAMREDGEYGAVGYLPGLGEGEWKVRKYQKVHYGSNWTWDTKLEYKPKWAKGLAIAGECTNVFNNKNVQDSYLYKGDTYKSYAPGRQFWLEVSYEY